MKKGLLVLFGLIISGTIIFLPFNLWRDQNKSSIEIKNPNVSISKKSASYSLNRLQKDGLNYVKLDEMQTILDCKVKVDDKNGQVFLTYGKTKVSFLKDVPVVEKNGLFYPMKSPLLYQGKQIWIPMETVGTIFDGKVGVDKNLISLRIKPTQSIPSIPNVSKMTPDQLISYLDFLEKPINGAHVSTKDSSLPGAPRTYRKGVHEGIDWYGGATTGILITKKTPVLSMADGIVVRVDHHYQEMATQQRQQLLALGKKNNGQTPQYVLDKLRGRSVWIQHDKGLLARYVHLDRVPSQLKVGQKIKKGNLIGYVGNSGTSDGAKRNSEGLHLHLDIFIYGKWFWDQYTMSERRSILESVFPKNK